MGVGYKWNSTYYYEMVSTWWVWNTNGIQHTWVFITCDSDEITSASAPAPAPTLAPALLP